MKAAPSLPEYCGLCEDDPRERNRDLVELPSGGRICVDCAGYTTVVWREEGESIDGLGATDLGFLERSF